MNPEWLVAFKMAGMMFLIGALLERLQPAERGQRWQSVLFNLSYAPIFLLATLYLVGLLSPLTTPTIERFGGVLRIPVPAGVLGAALHALLFFLVYDFFYYWWHRAQHELSWLWPQHELHHTERNLNFSTSMRHHWLEEPLRVFTLLLPMSLLFRLDPPTVGWVFTIFTFWGYFIHLNLRWEFGPLTGWLGGPQYHRIHHSIEDRHQNRNFAAFFPFYDRLFGTQFIPTKNEWPGTGMTDRPEPNSWRHALFGPFIAWFDRLTARRTRA